MNLQAKTNSKAMAQCQPPGYYSKIVTERLLGLQPFLKSGSKLALRLTEHPNGLPSSYRLSLVNSKETRSLSYLR